GLQRFGKSSRLAAAVSVPNALRRFITECTVFIRLPRRCQTTGLQPNPPLYFSFQNYCLCYVLIAQLGGEDINKCYYREGVEE
ncbi:MAG: hypothetical protein QXH12_08710, partial [Candidatus Caldarchaeum sp.]